VRDRPKNVVKRRVLLAAPALVALPAAAQEATSWPDRSVRVIVPYGPGATNDLVGRLLAASLTEALGQPFVVENRSGAQAILGTELAARSRPDGHTMLIGASGPVVFNPALFANLPYDTLRDFIPVSLLVSFPLLVLVPGASPLQDMAGLVASLRAAPEPTNYASIATSFQLVTELFLRRIGARGQAVAYRGTSEGVNAVAANQVAFAITDTAGAVAALQAGRVRPLAITSPARHPALPGVSTMAEAGLPGLRLDLFSGALLPAGTPLPIVGRLHAALVRAMAEPTMRQRLDALMLVPVASTPDFFRRTIEEEIAQWREVAREAGISLSL